MQTPQTDVKEIDRILEAAICRSFEQSKVPTPSPTQSMLPWLRKMGAVSGITSGQSRGARATDRMLRSFTKSILGPISAEAWRA